MFFRTIGFIIKYLPVLISAIGMVEGLTSKDTAGAEKKALVIATIKQFLQAAGVTLTSALETVISQAIDVAVTVLNLLGVFKHADERADEESVLAPQAIGEAVAKATAIAYPNDARIAELQAILAQQE